jgi:hypothetical protein
MDWIDTPESSRILRFKYDPARQTLTVVFKNDSTYDYLDVPEVVFNAMRSAQSKGQFLAAQIKGRFRFAPC